MELAWPLRARGASATLEWIPRDQKEEADALSNSDFSGFDADRRINMDVSTLEFAILPTLWKAEAGFTKSLEEAKAKR
jgi:hypothetical protein